jgi:hypothetical protein
MTSYAFQRHSPGTRAGNAPRICQNVRKQSRGDRRRLPLMGAQSPGSIDAESGSTSGGAAAAKVLAGVLANGRSEGSGDLINLRGQSGRMIA